jgi:hypothetical protein
MNPNKIVIKFEQVCDQSNDVIRRLIGFVKGRYLIDLINSADLNANPRSAKVGPVTEAIIESIVKTKDIFPFKTKGILLAVSSTPKSLERNRFELEFQNDGIEGILDGGHNTLAIALYILALATENDKALKKVKKWSGDGGLKETWNMFRSEIDQIKPQLDFLVPVEVLVPTNEEDHILEEFKQSILDICAARNNNVQLVVDTKANQAGHYDYVKNVIDKNIVQDVIWKTNEQGRIPVRDLITLSWVALNKLNLPNGVSQVTPVQTYSSKAKCMQSFIDLMEHKDISNLASGKYELKDSQVGSALSLLSDLPRLYDLIYKLLPDAYNSNDGKFGRIKAVKMYEPVKYKEDPKAGYLKKRPRTPFYNEETDYLVPDGFIAPIFYALTSLIDLNDGKFGWKMNPDVFLHKHLKEVMSHLKTIMMLSDNDPQKLGKNAGSYTFAKQQFEHCMVVREGLSVD